MLGKSSGEISRLGRCASSQGDTQVDFLFYTNSDYLLLRFYPSFMLSSGPCLHHTHSKQQLTSEGARTLLAVFQILLWHFPCPFLTSHTSLYLLSLGATRRQEISALSVGSIYSTHICWVPTPCQALFYVLFCSTE